MSKIDSLEEILETQRNERKELIAKTQKLKHSISKGDKKKKKEVTAEIAQMIADLDLKHQEQIQNFEASNAANGKTDNIIHGISKNNTLPDMSNDSEETNDQQESVIENSNSVQRISKAQKRRNKKVQQQKEREKAIAEQEVDNLTGLRHIESMKIKEKLTERGLQTYEIPSDGDCLYKAVEHQLSVLNLPLITVATLREETSKFLLLHKEDFLPFMTDPETYEILSEEKFQKYCDDIVTTPSWGGHVEIKVLSSICQRPIEVIQADGPSLIIGEENSDPKLTLSYHRHAFGLGEHYNSVITQSLATVSDDNM